ncbi:hypothetical protein IT399_02645 [Candidatus Nomurabacteria bacterium]|nr:hypothetical protein [Candidatus Nomurabacteria bacterium]
MLEANTIFEKIPKETEQAQRLRYNLLLESAKVGDRPFDKKFYEEAFLPHAIKQATNIAIIMGHHLGDATLSLPVITSIDQYLKLNSLEGKKITMISAHRDLFDSIKNTCSNFDLIDKPESFHPDPSDTLFCFNLNRKFHDYHILGIEKSEEQDPTRVFFHDCQDWMKEIIPVQPGKIKKYDLLPLRIMRNMEILLGQKLYDNIYNVREFIPKKNIFEEQKEELIRKFSIDRNKPLVIISPGSTAKGKEYTPECWKSLISLICEHKPDIQIFFLNDLNREKMALYGNMIDFLKREKPYNINRGSVALNEMRHNIQKQRPVLIIPSLPHIARSVNF